MCSPWPRRAAWGAVGSSSRPWTDTSSPGWPHRATPAPPRGDNETGSCSRVAAHELRRQPSRHQVDERSGGGGAGRREFRGCMIGPHTLKLSVIEYVGDGHVTSMGRVGLHGSDTAPSIQRSSPVPHRRPRSERRWMRPPGASLGGGVPAARAGSAWPPLHQLVAVSPSAADSAFGHVAHDLSRSGTTERTIPT